MQWLQFSFDRPWFLLLLLLLPVIWMTGWRSLSGLGKFRFYTALAFRSALLILLVCALAEIQLVRISQRIVALFLIDQSTSVAAADRRAAFEYAGATVEKHRDTVLEDEAGVIVFGAQAQIEHAPSPIGSLPNRLESSVDDSRTNLAGAMRLAKASFPAGVAKRVVILSDGNQNVGDALGEAREMAAAGIGIDVAPLAHGAQGDVVIDRVTAPAGARAGQAFEVQVVVDYRLPPTSEFSKPPPSTVRGKLSIYRRASGHTHLVGEEDVTLRAGKQVFQFRQQLEETAFYTYEARFVPAEAGTDHYVQNNSASAFTHLQGRGRVLLIVNSEHPQEFDGLAALLRKNELEVTIQPTNALFTSLGELQNYDCVVMGNVPRTTGVQADELAQFTDEQVNMLVKNVEQLGAGLVMIGGPESFGAGGWANTELEKALPVDLQVKNSKVTAVGALMLVIDKSGSMAGEKLELSKAAAIAAIGMLGPHDSVGVIAFDDGHEELISLQKVGDRAHRFKDRIKRLGPGGGTNMETGIKRGYDQLLKSKASVKHLIVLTDGQTAGSGYQKLAADMRKRDITTTTVAVGADASKTLLQEIATRGDGKYYQANNPKAIPKIFMKETRRVMRPLVFESDSGLSLIQNEHHEMLTGISPEMPPITGYVLTTLKENPLVEAPLLAPLPGSPNNTVLAAWTYGLGRTVAFTTDAGQRWASQWSDWGDRDKFFVQMIRWSMRPLLDQGNFTVATQVRDGELAVSVQAITKDGDFINNLSLSGAMVGDDNSEQGDLSFDQIGPGRYEAKLPLEKAGTYLLGIRPGAGMGVLRTGVNVPYSAEYKDTTTNEQLLATLASLKPEGGQPGELIRLPEDSSLWAQFSSPNHFRRDLPPGRLLTGVWPLFVLIAACLFLFDIANRRLQIPWDAVAASLARFRATPAIAEAAAPQIARLQATKRQTRERTTATWSPPEVDASPAVAETMRDDSSIPTSPAPPVVSAAQSSTPSKAPAEDGDGYSDRLLKKLREVRAKERDSRP
ncbi:VWA domain-containing protein [Anatilimnocola sp. NA78]|uniref:VWA domain-containing protein n=1 Tax=Anatilimnocola sp. NA78 TaxID=3415683 RepID=UPI003CE4CE37